MTQVARPQEKNENFSQIANVLIQGYSELDIQDRYVPIALASVCWEEKFYPLSLRQIASITKVNHTALRSRAGQHPREGVLDRLKRVGILDFREEKPIDPTTGKEGRSQTYICIRYSNIWKENTKFFAGKKAVKIAASVDVVNSDTTESVDIDNTSVDQNNHTVDTVNVSVDVVNHTVDGSCSNAAHNTMNTKNTINTIEDSKAVSAIASTPALPLAENTTNSYSHNNPTVPPLQASLEMGGSAHGVGYKTTEKPVNEPPKPKRGTRKAKVEQPELPIPKGVVLSSEEQRVFDLYCNLWFIAVPPKVNETRKQHCAALAPFVHSQEDMKQLEEVARANLLARKIKVRVTEMGNLVNSLNDWKASQAQPNNVIDFQSKAAQADQYNLRKLAERPSTLVDQYVEMVRKNGCDPDHPEITYESLLRDMEMEAAN